MVNKLYFIQYEKLYWQFINDLKPFHSFQFEYKKNKIYIYSNSKTYHLDIGKSIQIENVLFYFSGITYVQIFPIHNLCTIGRNKENTISITDSRISSFHARIENGVIYDLKSLNGTFVNSNKVQSTYLNVSDEICLGFHRFIYLQDYLVYESYIENKLVVDIRDNLPIMMPKQYYNPVYKPILKKYDIELYQMGMEVKKGSVLQAIGPSLMIASSSFISSFALTLLKQNDRISMISSFISSMTMSFVFVIYGLWNRNHQYKEQVNEEKKNQNLYISYLKEQEEILNKDLKEFQLNMKLFRDDFLDKFHSQSENIYIGEVKEKWCSFQKKQIRYDQKKDMLIQKRENLIDVFQREILQSQYVIKGIYWIKSNALEIIENYLWYSSDDRKIVWIGQFSKHDLMFYKRCIFENQFLYNVDPTLDSIVVTNCSSYNPAGNNLILYIGKEIPSFHIDQEIECAQVDFLPVKKRRMIMNYEMECLHDFYTDFLETNPIRNNKVQFCVPIGIDKNHNTAFFDFREYGPHGLVAGMTGSGKSEWLSFVIMMLAWYNSPSSFQYILIDFKGGAFGNTLYDLPHCAGLVTNLDKNSMNRFFYSIQYEIDKRQKMFRDASCSSIEQYNTNFELAHLWIVVDEFAQLKLKYPEMMNQLQEIARIGRSLGIHLILSTQKPLGVVDDQIWSNSGWKACFRVNSAQDSKEVVQNDEAYQLVKPGEFILNTKGNIRIQGFWLKEKLNHLEWKEVDIKNNELRTYSHDSKCFIDEIMAKLLALNDKRKWILHPIKIDEDAWGMIDVCTKQRQIDIRLDSCTYIYSTSKRVIYSVIDYLYEKNVMIYGTYEFEEFVDFCFVQPRYFSVLKDCVCIVTCLDGFDFTLIDKSVNLIFILDNPVYIPTINALQIACDISSKDEVREFFSMYQIPEFTNMVKIQGQLFEVFYREKRKEELRTKERSVVDLHLKKGLLGFDEKSDRAIYVDFTKKILILYIQDSVKEEVEILSRQLTGVSVYKIENKLLNSTDFLDKCYESQILWIGYGFNEYAYYLKRKTVSTTAHKIYFKDLNEGVGLIE